MNKIKQLLKLYLVFAKVGTFTIGGGLAMMPMLQKELIDKRHWITEDELLDYYAVGQSTPGIVAVNVSTFVGYKQLGILGGVIATLGMITPSLVIIMILAKFINSISDYPYVQKALNGVNVAVAALLTSVVVNLCKKTIKKPINVVFMLVAFVIVFFLKVPSFYVIIAALVTGVIITAVKLKKEKKNDLQKDSSKNQNPQEMLDSSQKSDESKDENKEENKKEEKKEV